MPVYSGDSLAGVCSIAGEIQTSVILSAAHARIEAAGRKSLWRNGYETVAVIL